MISSVACACGHPGPAVHTIAPEARSAGVFVARLAAVRLGWAVAVERTTTTGVVEAVCPRCLAHRTTATVHMESR